MALNPTVLNPGGGGDPIAMDFVAGSKFQLVQLVTGDLDGPKTLVTGSVGLPVSIISAPSSFAGGDLIQANYSTGGKPINLPMVGLSLPGTGGPVPGGTLSNPFRIEPIAGGTSQKVMGTVTVEIPLGTQLSVSDVPLGNGGLRMFRRVSTADTNAAVVVGVPAQVYAIQAFNINASPRYLKLYNLDIAPTVGTTAIVKTILLPGSATGGVFYINWDKGLEFSTGIAMALTTGIQDSDTGAVAANEMVVNIDYME